nr:hypothetical protein 9 [Pseudomonadaceae bacterium]
MTPESLEMRLEEWARWAQGGMSPANLGYSKVAMGFSGTRGKVSPDGIIPNERQAEVEAAIARLYVEGHGRRDEVRGKWIQKPNKAYSKCADIIRAHYRAHPAYGDARFEEPGNAVRKTILRLGLMEKGGSIEQEDIARNTYYRKLALARGWLLRELY